MSKDLIKQLRESHDFQVIMNDMLRYRPVVPTYKPQKTMDETANMFEQIKYSSAQQDGFDLLFSALTGNRP